MKEVRNKQHGKAIGKNIKYLKPPSIKRLGTFSVINWGGPGVGCFVKSTDSK